MDRARFDMFRHQTQHERIHARSAKPATAGAEPRFAASPLTPQPDRPVRIISMTVPDHAPPVAPRNHSLARITVVSSSQTRTRATMLALTSHYSATNAKHPRHAALPARRGLAGGLGWLSRRRRAGRRPGAYDLSPDRLTVTTGPTNPLAKRVRPDPSGTMFHRTGQSRPMEHRTGREGPRARLRAGRAQRSEAPGGGRRSLERGSGRGRRSLRRGSGREAQPAGARAGGRRSLRRGSGRGGRSLRRGGGHDHRSCQ